jgi:hypothetical protein
MTDKHTSIEAAQQRWEAMPAAFGSRPPAV